MRVALYFVITLFGSIGLNGGHCEVCSLILVIRGDVVVCFG